MNLLKFFKKLKTSLTIEASLALPIFLFAIMSLLYISEYMKLNLSIIDNLSYNAEKLALSKNSNTIINKILEKKTINNINKQVAFQKFLLMNDIYVTKKEINNHIINLIANYKVKILFNLLPRKYINMHNEVFIRKWCGYEEDLNERYVYITEYGKVYHTNRHCSHLDLTIKKIPYETIKSLRNVNGRKYKLCRKCRYKRKPAFVYITNYGNKYHYSKNCRGLKRHIKRIKFSKIGDMKKCSKCG